MGWLERLAELRAAGTPAVLVTVAAVRGHAPRKPGAKMIVAPRGDPHGSVGGGDLEARAVARARELLAETGAEAELLTSRLNPEGGEHGVQCCGGEVTLLLEPLRAARPVVAVFGAGHVGRALVRALADLPLELRWIDGRAEQLTNDPLPPGAAARLVPVHAPVPESAVAELPAGSHLVVLTHDHAEDLAIVDAALRAEADGRPLGYLGLIGSTVKWSHFRTRLSDAGHTDAALARVTTPIGLPGVPGDRPAAIALATAAQLLGALQSELAEGSP